MQKPVVETEFRQAKIERNVEAPIIKKEGFVGETKVLSEGFRPSGAVVVEEEKPSILGAIGGVLTEIKNAVLGDEPKK